MLGIAQVAVLEWYSNKLRKFFFHNARATSSTSKRTSYNNTHTHTQTHRTTTVTLAAHARRGLIIHHLRVYV